MKKSFSERLDTVMKNFPPGFYKGGLMNYKGGYGFDYEDDSYEDDSYIEFTQEEKDLVAKACFIMYNINWALRHIERGPEPGYDSPSSDKIHRELDDRLGYVTTDLFPFGSEGNYDRDKNLKDLVGSIMRKIRLGYRNAYV